MNIALAQINTHVGNLACNKEKIKRAAQQAVQAGGTLLITPELSLCGYPPEDLLFKPHFIADCAKALQELANDTAHLPLHILLGLPTAVVKNTADTDIALPAPTQAISHNSLVILAQGKVVAQHHKWHLPNDSVFDEHRYFISARDKPSTSSTPSVPPLVILPVQQTSCALAICEDMWHDDLPLSAQQQGVGLLLVANASPYHNGKQEQRIQRAKYLASRFGLATVYLNLVGGQDELVFDGASFAMSQQGVIVKQLSTAQEDFTILDIQALRSNAPTTVALRNIATPHDQPKSLHPKPSIQHPHVPPAHWLDNETLPKIWNLLVLGLRDYVQKSGFNSVLLGLSGGIDSALVACLAVDALGAKAVSAIMMPSPYTSKASINDAAELADHLGIVHDILPISALMQEGAQGLRHMLAKAKRDNPHALNPLVEENLQARLRGLLLMAVSNQTGALLLNTSNKSEIAVGYATLYGDMCGAFAPIRDVYKTQVYQLARFVNQRRAATIIPPYIIERAPSAELRENQTDQDSLPPYALLDVILQSLLEYNCSVEELVQHGHDETLVRKIFGLVKGSEYKRFQATPGTRLSARAFGKDWRMPLANAYTL